MKSRPEKKYARRCFVVAMCMSIACGSGDEGLTVPVTTSSDRPASCPATRAAPELLANVLPQHRQLDYWLSRVDADDVIMTREDIASHTNALSSPADDGRPIGQGDPLAPVDSALLETELRDRLDFMKGRIESGMYLTSTGTRLPAEEASAFDLRDLPALLNGGRGEWVVALDKVKMRCGPREEGLYTAALDLAFDRNNCSTVREQEAIQILASWSDTHWLARTGYAMGWVEKRAAISSALPDAMIEAFVNAPRVRVESATTLTAEDVSVTVPADTLLVPTPDGTRAFFASPEGVFASDAIASVPTVRDLTRREVFARAFAMLDSPYGWGGQEGGRDCSRFLLDIFSTFDLPLPRHSARQAMAGTFQVPVEDVTSIAEKQHIIDAAASKGVVFLHFPGHIMLYLGKTEEGTPMAIHAFSEYITPCPEVEQDEESPTETINRVDRVTVSDLSLGEGSSRRSFIERVTKVVVLGGTPGVELAGVAEGRPAAPVVVPGPGEECEDSNELALFRTPFRPYVGHRLRVIATTSTDPGPSQLAFRSPSGVITRPETHRLNGPPTSFWADLEDPREEGSWTVALGDGERVYACERYTMVRHRAEVPGRDVEVPSSAWPAYWRWEEDTENLYAAFVEQLFLEPTGEDTTWDGLQGMLRDPQRNLLHDHRLMDEEAKLALRPDCADLPYFLRAYFAWKFRLPFAFRVCSRGRAGIPPSCGDEPLTNLMLVPRAEDDIEAFRLFMRRVGSTVHSASARTVPRSSRTDVYPIELTRDGLRPGTVFADPYGHLLVIARWVPQTANDYGVLIGADAQPDGTVGRRRFWRGSFLFTPDTTDVGAGFKAWRPVVYDRVTQAITTLSNEELSRPRTRGDHPAYSRAQYEGTVDDFYDRMQGLINPRALDPIAMQVALVDALEESVARRVGSVDNGERFMREREYAPIIMPEENEIFQTSGPWEDYSTPSRDMRLLISVDAVVGFPGVVRRNPERFSVPADEVEDSVGEIQAKLDDELAARRFQYQRSDGETQVLSLADVVARREAMEMAYNPNDCIERRWGAPEGTPEARGCQRAAPRAQRLRMTQYRAWFRDRRRPR